MVNRRNVVLLGWSDEKRTTGPDLDGHELHFLRRHIA